MALQARSTEMMIPIVVPRGRERGTVLNNQKVTLTLNAYTDSDFVGYKLDRKNTSGTCQFLGNNLISWFSKKQNLVALSTAEAEYVVVESCCAQILWIKM